jgi:hypothetical protein
VSQKGAKMKGDPEEIRKPYLRYVVLVILLLVAEAVVFII